MQFSRYSRKLGQELEFFMLDKGGYIRVHTGKGEYKQICEGGCFMGSTLSATPVTFKKVCETWARQYVRNVGSNIY